MRTTWLLGLVFFSACGSKVTNNTPCESANPPAECTVACDPTAPDCPPGYYCGANGTCTADCTPGGNECNSDQMCDGTGHCVPLDITPDADCPSVNFTAVQTIPTVHLILDQSGSMSEPYGSTDRWNGLRNALIDPTTGVVANLESKVVFGATLYSGVSQSVNGTQVGIAPCPRLISRPRALNNYNAIRSMLQNANPIEDTPTAESIDAIRADFAANPPMAGSPPIIVLATDGLPDTCADADPPNTTRQNAANAVTVVAAQNAFTAGIKLFFLFVGSAAQAGTHPQRMANAGAGLDPVTGTAPYFEATDPAALTAAFNQIIGGTLSCELDLDGNVDISQASSGTVILNGQTLTYPTDWELVDTNTIRLLGAACSTLTSSTNPTVTAEFPCGAVIL
ncbi:MAG: vWA domain-containing protein [Kofleriaceae bacterium]